jgi:hypothetical protein
VRLAPADAEIKAEGPALWESHGMVCHALADGWRIASTGQDSPVCLHVTRDSAQVTVWMPPDMDALHGQETFLHLFRTALECAFPFQSAVSLHAACVAVAGGAVAFTAPSGTGKSARAQVWVESLGARLISGDRPAIRIDDGRALACGIPWDGKEGVRVQEEVPLQAICEVRRASFPRLRRLTAAQARRLLLKQCFLPVWDAEATVAALHVIERLIGCVPVYRFWGDLEHESARFAHAGLFGQAPHTDMEEPRDDMKIKEGFVLRNVMDEHIVMPAGKNIDTFEGALVLNDVSSFIWERLMQPVCRDDLLSLVLAEFDVDRGVASADLDVFLDKLRAHGVLDEE